MSHSIMFTNPNKEFIMAVKKLKTTDQCVIAKVNCFCDASAPDYACIKITQKLKDTVAKVSKALTETGMDEARCTSFLNFSTFNDLEGFTKGELKNFERAEAVIVEMDFESILDVEIDADIDVTQLVIYCDGKFSISMSCENGEIFTSAIKV